MEKGLGYRKLATKLGISSNTAKSYCAEVKKRGGTDCILRPNKRHKPDPCFVSPLAESLYEMCNQQKSNSLRWNVANTVLKKVMAYAVELGYEEVLNEALLERAVTHAPNRSSAGLVHYLKESIATRACQDDEILLGLCDLITARGLPTKRCYPNGRMQRAKCGFAMAALRAKQALADLRSRRLPSGFVEDVTIIWRYAEEHRGLQAGIERLGLEQEQRCMNWTSRIVLTQ